jgi:hypothetical protein
MEVSMMKNEYVEMDQLTPDGTFTIPSKMNIDMLALRKFCKENNIPYENLTDEDIKKFIIANRQVN